MSGQKIYKENIIDRIGGPMDYEMAVIDLCDRSMQDRTLKYHFRNMGSAALSKFQTELLELAFLDQSAAGNNHVDIRSIKLRQQRIIAECGFTEQHFDLIKGHVIESLRHSWCNGDVIEMAANHIESVRYLFEGDCVQALREKQVLEAKSAVGPRNTKVQSSAILATTTGQRHRSQK